jgi:GNAT superfamily N-acetyltransferase
MSTPRPPHDDPDPATAGAVWTIRPARPDDAELLVNLVRELAVYEKLEHLVEATADDFRRHLFESNPLAEAAIAEVAGEPVGFALWFVSFSTFRGRAGLYLEDLFVRPAHRGRGIGKGFLAMLARLAVDRGYARLEWSVLNWNAPAIGFYRSLGAVPMDEWTVNRLDGQSLQHLGAQSPAPEIAAEPRSMPPVSTRNSR